MARLTRFLLVQVSAVLQFSTEDLVKEVSNSIAEFEKHKQEYDEERVKEQVSILVNYSRNSG